MVGIDDLIGWAMRPLGFVIGLALDRTVLRVQSGVHEGLVAGFAYEGGGGSTFVNYAAEVRTYNAGRSRFTVNEAGWLAKDGTRELGHPRSVATLEPRSAEDVRRAGVRNVLKLADEHGGVGMYVQLAGESKLRTYELKSTDLARIREAAARPTESRF